MDPVSMDSAKLALLLKGPAVAGLDPPKRYRILRIGAHSITYGPEVIPLRNVVSVTMRSKLLQDGTRARQLIEMLITGIVLVGIALFDAIANQSALLKWTLASHAATIVLLLLLVKNAAPIALALLVGSGAAVLLWPSTAAAPQPELFGEYYAALERIWSGFAKPSITMLIVATGAALYASLSFLRSPWHARDIKAFFRVPYWPRMLTDMSFPQVAIERAGGRVLWIKISPYPFRGPEDRELQAQFGAAILSAVARQLNSNDPDSVALIDLDHRGILTSDRSLIRNLHEPYREKTAEEHLRLATENLFNQSWEVVERETVLVWHDLESIASPEAERMLRCLDALVWFAAEDAANKALGRHGLRTRAEDVAATDAARTAAKKAIRALENPSVDQPLFWNNFKPYRTDCETTPDTIVMRVREIAAWIQDRIDELEKPSGRDRPPGPRPDPNNVARAIV